MENERNGEVPHQSLCWKDSFGERHTQREKPGIQGAGKLCLLLLLLHPPAPARARAGVGERQRALPESILICCRRARGRLLLRTEHHPLLGKN